jgi:acetyltransferase-like isoleucine patch superfamily enzyme
MLGWLRLLGRKVLYHPRGMKIARTASVRRPHWILNPHRIQVGEASRIHRFARLEAYDSKTTDGGHVVIGEDVYIGYSCLITAMDRVEIGDGCVLADRVYVTDNAHGLDPNGGPIMAQPLESKGPVKIGRLCFIGIGSAIMPDVTLGDFCVVGANSVVTRSFPAYSIIAGSPARLIRVRDP